MRNMNSKLANALNDGQKQLLEEVCRKFETYTDEIVFHNLWNLTYRPEFALDKMGLVGDEFLKYYKKVRNYVLERSGKKIVKEESKYPKELFDGLGKDKIATEKLISKIDEALFTYPISELERINSLLNSSHTNYRYGGLRSLRFREDEANFFLKYVESIAKYFSEELARIKRNVNATLLTEVCDSTDVSSQPNAVKDLKVETNEVSTQADKYFDDISKSTDKEYAEKLAVISRIVENSSEILAYFEACDFNDSDNESLFISKWIIDHLETFKKVIMIVDLWRDVARDLLNDHDIIFNNIENIDQEKEIVEYINSLESLGLSPKWLLENKWGLRTILGEEPKKACN